MSDLSQQMRIGIDLGGTKVEVVVLDLEGEEIFRERMPTPQGSYQGTVDTIISLVLRAEKATSLKGSVGIGIPGAMAASSGLVKNANSVCLIGKPLQEDLQRALNRPVRIANDANCFAVSEATDGAAAGAGVVFGVIVGTGCGGGVVVNGEVISGINAIAGEWGHNSLPWPTTTELNEGSSCYCGFNGCIETWLSGPGFTRDYQRHGGEQQLRAADIVARALDDDLLASTVLEAYCQRMARALASVINIIDPDVIVLGGGMSNTQHLYQRVPEIWQKYIFSEYAVDTRLVQARHGDSSGVRGAAWLWPHEPQGRDRHG